MMLSELLQRLSGHPTISGRRRFSQSLRQLEALEHRALPAGNVTAQFIGRTLYVNGDSAANSVELAAESGNLVIRGLDGTTVNGSSSAVTLLSGSTVIPRGFYAHMGDGNDRLQVKTGVVIGRESIINGGWGDDSIGIVGAQFGRWLNIYTEAGNDQVSIQNTNIGRSATVMAWGPSLLTNISGSNIGDDLFISTTYGNDGVAITNTRVNDDVTIFTHGGTDDVAIRNSTFGDDLTVATGGEDDVLYIDASTILDHSWLFLGGGNDSFVVEGQSRFNDRIRTYGEGGNDLTEFSTTTVTNGFRTSSISLGNVSDSLVQQRITSPTTGVLSKAATLAAQFSPVLSLQLGTTTVEESGGTAATTLTVSRSVATQTPLTVNLSSSNASKATVPATATIPAGATSVTINVAAVNNNLFDNDATVTLTASATGFTNATTNLSVTNDDVRTLTATVNNSTISESAGATAATITVSRNTADTTAALTVNLTTTSNNNRITIPATLTIPAGAASATFNVAALANTLDDGDVQVTVVASASGFTNGSVNLTVTDDDAPALQLQVASSTVAENLAAGTVSYTLTRNSADISQPLIVNLNAGSQSRLTVPATVTIPANTTTVQFTGTINNNVLDDNNINVLTTASASGFSDVNVTVTILDDEPSILGVELSAATISEAAGSGALTATISRTAAGTSDLTVQLIYPQSGRISGPTEVVIPAGQLSVTVNINVVNNSVVEPNQTVVLSAFATNFDSGSDSIVITEDDSLLLTTDVSQNTFIQSNNAVIVQSPAFILAGTSAPGATVTYDSDNDGQFDDGTATADGSGNFSFTSNLTHTTANRGLNVLRVRSELNGVSIVKEVDAHLAVGTVVRFETNLGNYDVELLNTAAPVTVQNFLNYMNSTAYDNLIVHRSVNNFVIQGGGFKVNGGVVTAVPTNAAIQNEFNSANSNLRGTLSMALVSGNINSGTSQWFINTVNNTTLNAASHTVFGRVIGDGMDVVDAIAAVPIRNLANLYDITALGEVPLLNAPGSGTTLAGTVSVVTGSTQLIGTGTAFTTALQVGDSIELSGRLFFVQSIESNTALTLKSASLITATNVTAKADVTPADADFVVFSNISQLLAAI